MASVVVSLVSNGVVSRSRGSVLDEAFCPCPSIVIFRKCNNACVRKANYNYSYGGLRWHVVRSSRTPICKCLAIPQGLIEEQQGESIKEPNGVRLRKHDRANDSDDVLLRAAPKPLFDKPPKLNSQGNNIMGVPWAPKIDGQRVSLLDNNGSNDVELQEDNITTSNASNDDKRLMLDDANSQDVRKSGLAKSVWRKGEPVKPPQGLLLTTPHIKKVRQESIEQLKMQEVEAPTNNNINNSELAANRPTLSRPKPAASPESQSQPTLQPRPASAPKKVILRDVGAASKKPVADNAGVAPKGENIKARVPSTPSTSVRLKDSWRKKGASKKMGSVKGADAEEGASKVGASRGRRGRRERRQERARAAMAAAPVKAEIIEVSKRGMPLMEIAHHLAVDESEVIKELFLKGIVTSTSSMLEESIVKMLCQEYGVEVIEKEEEEVESMVKRKELFEEEDLDKLQPRPPVLTIMGHVDHGKTTLLDFLRKSKVAASEAGGITQGIGAYRVEVPVDNTPKTCVFLDTPGHEAFSGMRARGASVTDIVILVVAADDGVRPQTKEAIAHAKAANVPIVVAINKIDKEGANPEATKQELSSLGLIPEEWGGDVPMVSISALKGQNVNELLETTMLVAELQELKANPDRSAKGTVIEASLNKSRGPLATFLVQNGTLRKGDIVLCGATHGKVRALFDDTGASINAAGPSMAVQVVGLSAVPTAGEGFEAVKSLEFARENAEQFALKLRDERISARADSGKADHMSIDDAFAEDGETSIDVHELNLVLKVDVQGSLEAIKRSLDVLPQESVKLRFLMEGVGDVSAGDIDFASASNAILIGFNVKVPTAVKRHAERKKVDIRIYKVIYELVDEIRKAMEALLEPTKKTEYIGVAEVKAVFPSGSGFAAGCVVTEGKIAKECEVKIIRKGKVIHKGHLSSLRRAKEAAKEIGVGLECGIALSDFNEWEVGDKIEALYSVTKQRTLEEASSTMAFALSAKGALQ